VNAVKVWNASNGRIIGSGIQVADTSLTRMRGLLGRRGLSRDEGLWIKPSSGVHTFGMSFPIDVVGLDRDRKVIRLWNRLAPFRLTALSWSMRSVLELAPGRIAEADIHIGDSIRIDPDPRQPPHVTRK
jgi:uncharacterized protein